MTALTIIIAGAALAVGIFIGWAGALALITLVVAGMRDETWAKGLDWFFKP